MNIAALVSEIDAEIARLEKAKIILSESFGVRKTPGRPRKVGTPSTSVRRVLSDDAKARIAAGQKARWAKARKNATRKIAPTPSKKAAKKTVLPR
jgi:hypothetical protein